MHSALAEMRRDRGARHTAAQIRPLQERLDAIDTARAMSDGIFGGSLQHVPAGQAACRDLLERSYK